MFSSLPSSNTKIAGWNILMINRKYIFNPGPFSIAMLDYRSVISSPPLRTRLNFSLLWGTCHPCSRTIVHSQLAPAEIAAFTFESGKKTSSK